jgi:N-acetylneuraminic acid mutarotase
MLSLYGGSEEEMDGQNFGNNQTPSHFSGNGAAEGHCIVKLVDVPQNECPNIKNHSSIYYRNRIWLFGGYDGKKNHATVHALNVATAQWERLTTTGTVPEGRNGHTASLIANKMYVIGGWLGSGTFASSEVYILNLDAHEWTLSQTHGQSPGPCNMHSADVVDERFIYIFRGGDGKDYLNDLHRLDTETLTWTLLAPAGAPPPPRANHCSTLIRRSLYVFGGWDGAKRLNDIFYFHIDTGVWHEVNLASQAPSPRAGMSMVAIDEKIYLFGGSGPSASCFNDLQIFDP